jgi:ABC-type phosphate transport system substrate-binding protein
VHPTGGKAEPLGPYNKCLMTKQRYSPYRLSMSRRTFVSGTSVLLASSLVLPAHAEDLVVVVHPDNTENPTRAQLAAMFTTRMQSWNGGTRVVPLNFPPRHEVRINFDRSVLQMSPDEVARYWIDRKIRGGNPPPKAVESAQLICRLVAKLPGSVGYVPRSLAEGVRVIQDV